MIIHYQINDRLNLSKKNISADIRYLNISFRNIGTLALEDKILPNYPLHVLDLMYVSIICHKDVQILYQNILK